jgi:hypothetical protein
MATAALVCGIAGIVLCFLLVPSVVAVVLGAVADAKARAAGAAGGQPEGKGRARAGWILGVIGILLFLVLIVGGGLAGWYDSDRHVNDLEVGDCVELDVFDAELSRLPVVDCAEPHEGEVVYAADLFGPDEDFPGREAMRARVRRACGDAFERYVGTHPGRSELDLYYAVPSRGSWDDGDRMVVCFAIRPDGGTLERSVRDSGL